MPSNALQATFFLQALLDSYRKNQSVCCQPSNNLDTLHKIMFPKEHLVLASLMAQYYKSHNSNKLSMKFKWIIVKKIENCIGFKLNLLQG